MKKVPTLVGVVSLSLILLQCSTTTYIEPDESRGTYGRRQPRASILPGVPDPEQYRHVGSVSCRAASLEGCQRQLLLEADSMGADVVVITATTMPTTMVNSNFAGNSTHMTGAAYRKIGPAVAPRAAECLSDAEIEQQRTRLDGLLERNAITAITHRQDVADIESRRCPPDDADMGAASGPDAGQEDAGSAQDPVEPEKRLEQLKRLHERGLITDEEYEAKRAQILETL